VFKQSHNHIYHTDHIQQLLRTLLLSPFCTAMKIRKKLKMRFYFLFSVDWCVVRTVYTTQTHRPPAPAHRYSRFAKLFFFVSVFLLEEESRLDLRTLPLLSSPLSYRIDPLLSCPLLCPTVVGPYRIVLRAVSHQSTRYTISTHISSLKSSSLCNRVKQQRFIYCWPTTSTQPLLLAARKSSDITSRLS
jgi:hypothetical protein